MPSILSLMSPPETKPLESFSSPKANSESPSVPCPSSLGNKLPPFLAARSPESKTMKVLPSPPVSPWKVNKQVDCGDGGKGTKDRRHGVGSDTQKDPVLFPSSDADPEVSMDQPLFPSSPERAIAEEVVDRHMASHMSQFEKKVNRPTREEYLLALSCISNIGRSYNQNPGAYLKRTREDTDNQYWKAKRICARPGTTTSPNVKIAPAVAMRMYKKPAPAVKQQKSTPRVRRVAKPSPREKRLASPSLGRSATPDVRAVGAKRPEDIDYNALPDYSPSTTSLPAGNSKCLKTDWASNNPLNLSNDSDRHMLHEAEVVLASTLRLSCATYLCSKRRIFEARLGALKIGKEFRKTDAQQACKIDVNKASKLWTAYDKVGWFNQAYFVQYL